MNEILETLRTNSPKIAVLGDSILDAYYVGFLRETQESIFIPQKRYYHLGGAGNVAYSIRRLGGTPLFYTVLGVRANSKTFHGLLTNKKLLSSFCLTEETRDISLKTRLVADNRILLRLDEDYDAPISADTSNRLYSHFRYNMDDIRCVVVSDYQKGCIGQDLFERIKKICLARNIRLLVDSKSSWDFSGIFLYKPTVAELEKLLGRQLAGIDETIEYGMRFKQEQGIENMVITLDANGLIYLDDSDMAYPISSVCKAPVDPTGAGDSMMAAMAVCLANGIPMDAAVRFANEVAAISCERMGTVAVSLDMLEKRVQG